MSKLAKDRISILAPEAAGRGHVDRKAERRLEMVLYHHQIEKIPARGELDEQIDVRIGPRLAAGPRAEHADPLHAHPAKRRKFASDRPQQFVEAGVCVGAHRAARTVTSASRAEGQENEPAPADRGRKSNSPNPTP